MYGRKDDEAGLITKMGVLSQPRATYEHPCKSIDFVLQYNGYMSHSKDFAVTIVTSGSEDQKSPSIE